MLVMTEKSVVGTFYRLWLWYGSGSLEYPERTWSWIGPIYCLAWAMWTSTPDWLARFTPSYVNWNTTQAKTHIQVSLGNSYYSVQQKKYRMLITTLLSFAYHLVYHRKFVNLLHITDVNSLLPWIPCILEVWIKSYGFVQ